MNNPKRSRLNPSSLRQRDSMRLALCWLALALLVANSLQVAQANHQVEPPVEPVDVYPYYMQSPNEPPPSPPTEQNLAAAGPATKRATILAAGRPPISNARALAPAVAQSAPPAQLNPITNNFQPAQQKPPPHETPAPQQQQQPECLYDKRYFLELDQCLERRPSAAIGLAAFKNNDMLIRKGLSDKFGCSFVLSNGHFKSFSISKYSLDSDTQCLDQDQTSQLNIQFSNITLYYLWQLRCLNYANQLLDDATLDGRTLSNGIYPNDEQTSSTGPAPSKHNDQLQPICVGSSQSFGFAALQLSSVEAQVELSIDIYKNWRVTNVTVAMISPGFKLATDQHPDFNSHDQHQTQHQPASQHQAGGERAHTGIKDFTFDTIDGDELNWRYSHLYENWTRNRLHVNFLDQFKRFLWVSMQRCLSESSEKLPIKLNDIFGNHKYI